MIDLETAEMESMQRWAYYSIVDEFAQSLLVNQGGEMQLTTTERQILREHEVVIERGFKVFVEVGNALMEIREHRLYRADYDTFEEYCRDRWGMSRRHANRLVEAAEVANNLGPMGPIPQTERQARPLAPLPPEQQREAWQQAVESAPNGKVTAAHVEKTVATYQESKMSQPFQLIMSQDSEEWYTPEGYINLAREVMGGIDLDPATSALAQERIKATVFYTVEDDGLTQPWLGRVWLNPPYTKTGEASNAELWSSKLIQEYQAETVTEAILLVSNKAGYRWFEAVWDQAAACFARDLICFIRPDGFPAGKAKVGSVFFYFGPNLARFAEVFGRVGRVVSSAGRLL